jgi:hypothetical protein
MPASLPRVEGVSPPTLVTGVPPSGLDKGSLSIGLPRLQGGGHRIISGMVRRGFHCCYHRTGQNRSGAQPPPPASSPAAAPYRCEGFMQ